jgi:hypothetical protein
MAKRKAAGGRNQAKKGRKAAAPRRSGKRPIKKSGTRKSAGGTTARRAPVKRASAKRAAPKRATAKRATPKRVSAKQAAPAARKAAPRLDRVRRTLDETVQTPPSSLDMPRRGSAARTGRAEMAESRRDHGTMTPAITGGDVDADFESAYFSGDEAPGGDNPTPDQDLVDDIGKALGVEYQDNEELKASDKVAERDKHRWEMDPASSEDYKERKP